jgi:hypothetical protein
MGGAKRRWRGPVMDGKAPSGRDEIIRGTGSM